jgi:hypothetical protein
MWCAHKNVETGVVHAVALPGGMSPHGFALNWPLVRTDEPLTCHLCLLFAYARGGRDEGLARMLPPDETPSPR